MDFAFSEEQEELGRTVRAFLAHTSPETETRRLMETPEGFDRALWRRMGTELGLQGLAVPEEYGGAGCGPVEVGVVMGEMGRALLCAPFLSSAVLATTTLLRCADEEARKRLLPSLACGELVGTLALTEDSARWDAAGVRLTARESNGSWLLTGHKTFVLDGATADVVLTVARIENATDDGIGVFCVEGDAPGLTRAPLPTMDPTRRQARLDYQDVPATRLRTHGDGWDLVSEVLDRAAVALAAEQVGVASRALDMAVEYAKVRHQFGRPIGSFQAVKHLLADVLLEVESARAAAHYALLAAENSESADPELPAVASLAKAFCSDACVRATEENIQVHGGIGFTWEHPAHLYLKRAKTSQLLFGDPAYHRELLARRIGMDKDKGAA
ncbi:MULTISPECIES: acyl-CoA dehydrogenase family protein [Streptomyces]|uniref:Pimeloyl-CoA dehydrogenase, small subunit n=1 Tax=Streptomyces sviceus (strain ATCC 29083 / DSM 924 / JCM 4929 / NBRC 13980 / NCIMB 11184 / NRRL 5439 / UC 5370) TaxID=463191 RepID=B5HPD4_STRX2|nr:MULTISPECIES: acyl-CoA dehydrogenase family protein [Streptomyces]EDY54710.1 pimeloyl-CoA dehydrogenase, small subunit [Streptomyces sviceus ATCC 29083]MYT10523.1 acyl-CoA dehydrogenase [Streptomyces sp. SID5470]